MVSIICNTYNHEKYIKDTLDGFLMQKTNFKFEILIHDDASTDHTADIIREYEKKYPDIIKPIYQTENQYSKKNGAIRKLQSERIKGKYTALCEGDDFWIDENKLQRQVDFMENNPDYTLCAHSHIIVNAETKEKIEIYGKSNSDRDLSVKEIIIKEGECMATNSMLFRSEYYINRPKEFTSFPVGDYPLALYLAFSGKVRYMGTVMSAYRFMADGSWSSKFATDNIDSIEKRIVIIGRIIKGLSGTYKYSDRKNHIHILKKQVIMLDDIRRKAQKISKMGLFKELYISLPYKHRIAYRCLRIKIFINRTLHK